MPRLRNTDIPVRFPVRPLRAGQDAKARATCGECGLSWDDGIVTSMTPAPSARCPFESFHKTLSERQKRARENRKHKATERTRARLDYHAAQNAILARAEDIVDHPEMYGEIAAGLLRSSVSTLRLAKLKLEGY